MTYLDDLVAGARARVAAAREREPDAVLRARAEGIPHGPSFAVAIEHPGVSIIAEIKRASPSKGDLAPNLDAKAQGTAYRDGGAAAVSVLTEPDQFKGSLDDLAAVARLGIATLRKDFLVDRYQVWEARAAGASAVLVIVAAVNADRLKALVDEAHVAGLHALVEVHSVEEVPLAIASGGTIFGVNARDMATFEVDRDVFARVRPLVPAGILVVDESGITSTDDIAAARLHGADAVLVGELVVTASDPKAAVAELVAAGRPPAGATVLEHG